MGNKQGHSGSKSGKRSKQTPQEPAVDISTPKIEACDLYRISFLGERGTGKSALFDRITLGKLVDADPDEERTGKATLKDGIQLEMIDTASSINSKVPSVEYGSSAERFQGLALQFMNIDSCSGFILCFSLAKRDSFVALEKYYDFILAVKSTAWWPVVLVGTHSDLVSPRGPASREITQQEIKDFCEKCHSAPYIEIDSKDGTGVSSVLDRISECIVTLTRPAS